MTDKEILTAQPEKSEPPADSPEAFEAPEDEMSVADTIGERIEMGKGGVPIFYVVAFIVIIVWAFVAWKPWTGY